MPSQLGTAATAAFRLPFVSRQRNVGDARKMGHLLFVSKLRRMGRLLFVSRHPYPPPLATPNPPLFLAVTRAGHLTTLHKIKDGRLAYIRYNSNMESSEVTLTVWEPTDAQLNAAQLRAAGYSLKKIADEVGISIRTMERWNVEPHFSEMVMRLRHDLMTGLEPKIGLLMDHAADVMISVMKGEIHGDDHRADIARKILRDTAFRLMVARVGGTKTSLQADSD